MKKESLSKQWKKGLEKSRSLRLLRRVVLFGLGAATAALIIKFSARKDEGSQE